LPDIKLKKGVIEIKKIEEGGDYNRFAVLFKKCFRQEKDREYFKWKYFDNPAGKIIGYEAITKGKTVASYGVIPEFYWVNGLRIRIFQAADAMVSPRYWGKNLFNEIAQKIQKEIMEADNHTFMVAYPGILSRNELLNKLDWEMIKSDCKYIFIPRTYHKLKSFFRWSQKIEVKTYTQMDEDLKQYLDNYKAPTAISKSFDSKIFNWKIFDRPDLKYKVIGIRQQSRLIGLCVYRIDTPKTCEICWLSFDQEKDYQFIPEFTKYIFAEPAIQYIHTWKPLDKRLEKAFKRGGFLENSFSKGPFNYTFPYLVYIKNSTFSDNASFFDGNEFYPIFLD